MNILRLKRSLLIVVLLVCLTSSLWACSSSSVVREADLDQLENMPAGMSAQDAATLLSLDQIDDFPLYTMVYQGGLELEKENAALQNYDNEPAWACSLFTAYGDSEEVLFGRNFDWDFSPALLLFMDPPDGYASVSMVDIYYLGFRGERASGITDLPLEERVGLLNAPYLPFDGMNETGLVIGMAAVPPGNVEHDPEKETIDSLMVMRKILDQAATIEEAVEIFQRYNVDMGSTPIHYLISERSGRSALIEFSKGEILVLPNENNWQIATNFLMSEAWTDPGIHCGRYDLIEENLEDLDGKITPRRAMNLLERVAQLSTQWSVVYRASANQIWISMGGEYQNIHKIEANFESIY